MPVHAMHPVTAARNRAEKEAQRTALLSGRPLSWLAMFDNDVEPPNNVWDVLLNAPPEADIVILPYWVWMDGELPMVCVGQWDGTKMNTPAPGELAENAWNEIGAGGTGAMFIRGRVFTDGRLTRPFFKIKYDDFKAQSQSEDIYFTSMCKEAGLRIFTHTGYVCGHHRTLDLAQVNMGMAKLFEKYKETYGAPAPKSPLV